MTLGDKKRQGAGKMAIVTVVGIRLCPASSIGLFVCPRGVAEVLGLFQDAILTGKQFI